MYAMVELWQRSGVSQPAYAEQQGVSHSTILYWCRQYREQRKSVQGHELVRHREFVPLRTEISSQDTHEVSVVVITLASGTRIEVR
jgi:transposase-like protein